MLISDVAPSNSSLLEFYNEVMTFNDSVVELVCCKLDGSPVSVSCGQGLSCAAACFSKEAVLCPSHNCEDCDNVDGVSEESEQRKEEDVKEIQGGRYWATHFSGAMAHCTYHCNVRGRNKYCCFHPICRKRKRRQCSWFQYLLGELNHISIEIMTSEMYVALLNFLLFANFADFADSLSLSFPLIPLILHGAIHKCVSISHV